MLSILLLRLLALNFVLSVAAGAERNHFRRHDARADNCDIRHALHVLESLSGTGESFCTSLLHTKKGETETVSDIVTSTEVCSVRTETTTEHGTFTTFTFSPTIYLPQLTSPSYTSTVFIPSGPSRPIAKRNTPPTPTDLTTCAPNTITTACSSLLRPTTTTLASTTTHTKHSYLTTTTVTFTTTRHTTTLAYPLTITPPPDFTPATGTHTTTVPADCLSGPYVPPGGVPSGDVIDFPQYPDQPRSPVECCVVCHHTENCIASSYDTDSDECQLLVRVDGSSGVGVSAVCPLGVQDFPFGVADPGGDILPGPCGQ